MNDSEYESKINKVLIKQEEIYRQHAAKLKKQKEESDKLYRDP